MPRERRPDIDMDVRYELMDRDEIIAVNIYSYEVSPFGLLTIWHEGGKKLQPDIIYAPGTWTHLLKVKP